MNLKILFPIDKINFIVIETSLNDLSLLRDNLNDFDLI